MSGYAHIHRRVLAHPVFRNESEALAFVSLILKAAWKATRVRYKDRVLTLQRGQVAISQRDMARALDRDKAWIERLWKRLRAEAMIEVASEAGVAVITICNYDDYQAERGTGKAANEAVEEAGARQAQGTEQRREEVKKISSEANASGDEAPADPVKTLFDLGISLLTEAGQTEKQARSLVGKWRKAKPDGEVLTAFLECRAESISNPVEWLTKRLQVAKWVSKSGYEYRGDDEAVMREAQKRADWNTYWAVKSRIAA
jgi:hypothetical protein